MAVGRKRHHHQAKTTHHRRRRRPTYSRPARRIGGIRSTAKRVVSKTFNNDIATVAGAVATSALADMMEQKLIPDNFKKYTNIIELAVGLMGMRYMNNKFAKGVSIGLAIRGATNLLHSKIPAIHGFEVPHLVPGYQIGATKGEKLVEQAGGYNGGLPDPNFSNVFMRNSAYYRGGNMGVGSGYRNIFQDEFK